jgi:hypothetical protein
MTKPPLVAILVFGLAGSADLGRAATPRYSNVELVSISPQTRLVVIKNTEGREETLKLDDTVAGLDGFQAGDRVILTVRTEPGMSRVSAISKSAAATSPPPGSPSSLPPAIVPSGNAALDAFAGQVATLARQAAQVDSAWNSFKTTCDVTLSSSYPDGRDWFSLWDGTAQMDVTSGNCRDLFNQVVTQGEAVRVGMAGAEDGARRAGIAPGDVREVRQRFSMEWGGWSLPAPDPLKL